MRQDTVQDDGAIPALRVALQTRSSHRRTRLLTALALLLPGGTAQDCRFSQSCLGKPTWKTAMKQALCTLPLRRPVRSQQRWLRVPGQGTWWCSICISRGTCSRDASSACHHALTSTSRSAVQLSVSPYSNGNTFCPLSACRHAFTFLSYLLEPLKLAGFLVNACNFIFFLYILK